MIVKVTKKTALNRFSLDITEKGKKVLSALDTLEALQ